MIDCAIVGLGAVLGPQEGVSGRAMQAEAARRAIEDAGLSNDVIDAAIDIKVSPGGREHPSYTDAFPRVLGLPVKTYFSIGRGGSAGALGILAAMSLLDRGIARYVVCSGFCEDASAIRARKAAGTSERQDSFDKKGYWARPFGDVHAASHHSFFASRHMHEFGTTSEQLGAVAVAHRAWACLNPDAAMFGRPMTIEDHQASPMVVWPYHLFDVCQASDGAVAFVLTSDDRAADTRSPVPVLGIGFGEAMQSLWWEKENYTRLAVDTAKGDAFSQAGITLDDIDLAQLYDCFTAEVIMQLEDYGWCKKGEGGPFAAEGHIAPGGRIPINTSGGLLSAYHYADLTGLHESVLQLRGEAGQRQVDGAQLTLFSGHGGEALAPGMCSTHSTVILGKERA